MTTTRLALAAALAAASLAAGAAQRPATIGTDYTDLWWNPQESGWGMNVVQQGETAFITLFVYGPDGKPTWYFASNARVYALDADGIASLRGTLYKAKGPWIGEAFDPSKVEAQAVGEVRIEPRPDARTILEYTADGVTVSKEIRRQTFAAPDVGTTYLASFSLGEALPGTNPVTVSEFGSRVLLQLAGNLVYLRVEEPAGRCEYRGTRSSTGKFARLAGNYTCAAGDAGSFEIVDFEVTRHGISGFMRTVSPSRERAGPFAAARL
jgi:hypothetical protein